MKEPNGYNVRAVERALQILNSFDDEHPERGVSEISKEVGLHKATTHRILTTLAKYGFIERSLDGSKYRLGVQLIDLGFKVTRRLNLRKESLPVITDLALKIDETVDLSIFDQMEVLYVEVIQSRHALTVAAAVGRHVPAYCTASGKLFLSQLTEEQLTHYLNKPLRPLTKNTIVEPDGLKQALEEVRQNGYALDNEEFEYEVRAVAAPIRDQHNKIAAVISVPGPASRLTLERIEEITPLLLQSAEEISRRLGYTG